MKASAAVVLIEKNKIALIERCRSGRHYFVFPGGKVKSKESPLRSPQFYFLAKSIGGQFGHGSGSEMSSTPDSENGSYLPVWVRVNTLLDIPVLPKIMAEFTLKSYHKGWSEKSLIIIEHLPDNVVST